MQQFRRFATAVNFIANHENRGFPPFLQVLAAFLCQGQFFHFCEKRALASWPRGSHKGLSGRESAPGAREKRGSWSARLGSRATGPLCLCRGYVEGGARTVQVAGSDSLAEARGAATTAPIEAAWESIRSGLRRDLGARTFDGWLRPGGARRVRARQRRARPRHAEPVHGRLGPLAFRRAADAGVADRSADRPRSPDRRRRRCAAAVAVADPRRKRRRRPSAIRNAPNFDPRYRFETFVVGKANEVAATAAHTLATAASVNFNPLFIHGGTGRGKTHLLHAIGHAFLAQQPRRARRLDVGREVHGRVHPRAERE